MIVLMDSPHFIFEMRHFPKEPAHATIYKWEGEYAISAAAYSIGFLFDEIAGDKGLRNAVNFFWNLKSITPEYSGGFRTAAGTPEVDDPTYFDIESHPPATRAGHSKYGSSGLWMPPKQSLLLETPPGIFGPFSDTNGDDLMLGLISSFTPAFNGLQIVKATGEGLVDRYGAMIASSSGFDMGTIHRFVAKPSATGIVVKFIMSAAYGTAWNHDYHYDFTYWDYLD